VAPDAIVEELKILPAKRLEEVAAYIHHLRLVSQTERLQALRDTAGSLTREEADDWAKAVEDCERIVDHFRGDPRINEVLESAAAIYLPAVALGELYYGAFHSAHREKAFATDAPVSASGHCTRRC
jgi:hypothetical protein